MLFCEVIDELNFVFCLDQIFVDKDWDEIVENQTGDHFNFPNLHWIFRVHLELFGDVSQDGQGFINPPTLMLQHWEFIDPFQFTEIYIVFKGDDPI